MKYQVPPLEPAAAYDEAVEIFAYVKDVQVASVVLPIPDRGRYFYIGATDPCLQGVTFLPHAEALNAKDLVRKFKNSRVIFDRDAYRGFMAVHSTSLRKLNKAGCKVSCQDGAPHIDRTHSTIKLQNKSVLRFRLCRRSQLAQNRLNQILNTAKAQLGGQFSRILCKTSHGKTHQILCRPE